MGNLKSRTLALVCLVIVAAGTAFSLALDLWRPNYLAAYYGIRANGCRSNLQQVNYALRDFQDNTSAGFFPTLSATQGKLMFERDEFYDVTNLQVEFDENYLVCPGPAVEVPEEVFDDTFYVYTGYLLTNDDDVLSFASAYQAQLNAGGDFADNLDAESSYGTGDTIFRLRDGIERFLITDINNPGGPQSAAREIPVLWEWPDNHQQGWGGNVLYLDGHTEWQNYPGEFPMTEAAITALAEIAGYEPPTAWNDRTYPDHDYTQDPYGFVYPCADKLRTLGYLNRDQSYDVAGRKYLPLSPEAGKLMFEADELIPQYTRENEILECPGRVSSGTPEVFDDEHYAYWGYLLLNDDDVLAFQQAYQDEIAAGGNFTQDLDVPSSYGDSLLRLRDGVGRMMITDINSPQTTFAAGRNIPIMIEWPDNHENLSGGNVLYMDGHTEWHDYPGEFPMTETAIAAFRAIAEYSPPVAWAENPNPQYLPENDPYQLTFDCRRRIQIALGAARNYMYSSSDLAYPPLSTTPGKLLFDEAAFAGTAYLDPLSLVCPAPVFEPSGSLVDDQHYFFTPYALLTDGDVQAFATAYAAELAGGGDFASDLPGPTSYGDTFWRIRYTFGDDPFMQPPGLPLASYIAEEDIPVFIEWPGNHEGLSGGHVVYLDNHVEWIEYPGKFPMTEAAIATFASMANWTPATAWNRPPISYASAHDPYNQILCALNAQDIGYALRYYPYRASNGIWPDLSPVAGTLMSDNNEFLTQYLIEPRRLNCPGSPNAYRQPTPEDHSYAYLGYLVSDQASLEAFAAAYQAQLAAGGDFSGDLGEGEGTILHLYENVVDAWNYLVSYQTDKILFERQVPVLIEWPDNHGDIRGGNVLFLDGQVEWMEYPSTFPMTEDAMAVLTELAGRGPIRAATPRGPSRLDTLLGAGAAAAAQ